MNRYEAMEIFVRVVDSNSFSKASDLLDLPRAKVSRSIQALETHLGVRLLNRSTRKLSLSDDGALFYKRSVKIIAEVAEAESSLSNRRENPTGTLRVDTSGTLARALLIPRLTSFYDLYPKIEIRLGLADRNIDLIQDGADCVVRMGSLMESSLIAKRIGEARAVTCASPLYLEKYGTPTDLDDLRQHRAVNYVSARSGKTFPFEFYVDKEIMRVPMQAGLSANDGSVYIHAGVAGYGIIQPSRFMVSEHLKRGELLEILDGYACPATSLSVVYPHRKNMNPKLRVFVKWISDVTAKLPDLAMTSTDHSATK